MLDIKRRVTNLFAAGLLMLAAIFGLLGEATTSTGVFHDSTQTVLAAPSPAAPAAAERPAPAAAVRPAPAAAGRAPVKRDYKCTSCGGFHGGSKSPNYCPSCFTKIINGGKPGGKP
jgi:hypothetical protein